MKKWMITAVLSGSILASMSAWAQVQVGVWVGPRRPVYIMPPPLFIPPPPPPAYRIYPPYPYQMYAPPVYRAYPPPVVIVPRPPIYRHRGYGYGRRWRRW